MIDTNAQIEQQFFTKLYAALQPIGVGVYINYVPNELISNEYVEFSIASQSDTSNMNESYTEAIVTVKIHTKSIVFNDGIDINTISGKIYESILPYNLSTLLINGKHAVIKLTSDITQGINLSSDEHFLSRYITFTLSNIYNN